ncbi:hypothetical protein HDU93_001150 [Gonapodya sp. JEL0774]|nr:hypothetical protein HDU93_001150 [Gonapodya sp. JEL0774]
MLQLSPDHVPKNDTRQLLCKDLPVNSVPAQAPSHPTAPQKRKLDESSGESFAAATKRSRRKEQLPADVQWQSASASRRPPQTQQPTRSRGTRDATAAAKNETTDPLHPQASIAHFPPEVLCKIFQYIHTPEWFVVDRYVCRTWWYTIMYEMQPDRRLPVKVNIVIVNGMGRPRHEDEDRMRPGFNVVARHTLVTANGSAVPLDVYDSSIRTFDYEFMYRHPDYNDQTCYGYEDIYPREFARRTPDSEHLTDPRTDDLAGPLYRVPEKMLLLQNQAYARDWYKDPNHPWFGGRKVRVGLWTEVSIYYKEPGPGEVAVWTVADLEELAHRAVERQLGRPILGDFGGIKAPDWKAPEMLLDIAFYTNASSIGCSTRWDYLTDRFTAFVGQACLNEANPAQGMSDVSPWWKQQRPMARIAIFNPGNYTMFIDGEMRSNGMVSLETLGKEYPSVIWSGRSEANQKALDDAIVERIRKLSTSRRGDKEKDDLVKKLLHTMNKIAIIRLYVLTRRVATSMTKQVLMDPYEFDPLRRNPQLQAYFEHVLDNRDLNIELPVQKQNLVRFTLEQLKEGKTHRGVKGSDIGFEGEEHFNEVWETELFPIHSLLLTWWRLLEPVSQPDAFDSEETTTMFTGLFFELLTKWPSWKRMFRNQKPPNGNEDDRPDKTWTSGKHSLVELEAKSPSNKDFPLDAMKGSCSCAHSVREMRKGRGERREGERLLESLLILAQGPCIYVYATQEPYGSSDIAVTMPIYPCVTIPTSRDATWEVVCEFIGLILAVGERADCIGELLDEALRNEDSRDGEPEVSKGEDEKGKGKASAGVRLAGAKTLESGDSTSVRGVGYVNRESHWKGESQSDSLL